MQIQTTHWKCHQVKLKSDYGLDSKLSSCNVGQNKEICVHVSVSDYNSAAEFSSVKANLSQLLQISDNKSLSLTEERDQLNSSLIEVTKERDRLQSLSERSESLNVCVI